MTGGEAASAFGSSQAGLVDWVLPLLVASLAVGVLGLVMQQLFLRWNQGQELRQALITIAISVIIADQALAHFGGIAQELAPPEQFPESVDLRLYDVTYPFFRIFVLLVGDRDRARALGRDPAHALRDDRAGRRRRPADGLGARHQRPARLRRCVLPRRVPRRARRRARRDDDLGRQGATTRSTC